MFERVKAEADAEDHAPEDIEKHSKISNDEMHNILVAYFLSHDEDKIDHVDSLIEHFEGRFHILAKKLEKRYGEALDVDDHSRDHVAIAHFQKAQKNLHSEVLSNIAIRKTKEEIDAAKLFEKKQKKLEKIRREKYFNERKRIHDDREKLIREVDVEFEMTWGPIEPDRFNKSLFRNMGRGLSPRTQRIKAMNTW